MAILFVMKRAGKSSYSYSCNDEGPLHSDGHSGQPYGHDKARVFQVIGVCLVVVFELNSQSKLVQGDSRVHLEHSQLK